MMKLTIVNSADPLDNTLVKYPSLVPAYLAAYTPSDWEIKLVDENFEVFRPEECDADLVAFSAVSRHVNRAYVQARMLYELGITSVGVGAHVSAIPEEAMDFFDSVVEGDSEPIWESLLRDFEFSRLKRHYHTGFAQSLDTLKIPDRRYIHPGYFLSSAATSRGCQDYCSSCFQASLRDNVYRTIPTDRIIEDFSRIPQQIVVLSDANFLGFTEEHRNSRRELCEALLKRGIRKYWCAKMTPHLADDPDLLNLIYRAGCRLAMICFRKEEEDSQIAIDKRHKNDSDPLSVVLRVQQAGIAVVASLALGLEHHGTSSSSALISWLERARPLILDLGVLTPLPNTPLYQKVHREERLMADGPELWCHLGSATNTMRYKSMSENEVKRAFHDIVTKFYRPRQVAATFVDILRRRQPQMLLFYLGAALHMQSNRYRSVAFSGRSVRQQAEIRERRDTTPLTMEDLTGKPQKLPGAEFSALTWNINQWPLIKARPWSKLDVKAVEKSLRKFDIVCLQQCWSQESLELRWGFPFHYYDHRKSHFGLGSGLLILSKYPIRAWHSATYSTSAFPDSLAAKGVSLVRLVIEDFGEIEVINTSLRTLFDQKTRESQFKELLQLVRQRARCSLRLYMGDLKISPDAPVYGLVRKGLKIRDLLEENPIISQPETPPRNQHFRWPFFATRVDSRHHILLWEKERGMTEVLETGALLNENLAPRLPLDHRGLWAKIRVSPPSR